MWVCWLWLVTAVTIQFLSTRPLFCFRVSMLHRSYYSAAACVSADQECVRSGLRTDLFVCTASYPASGDRIPALRLRVFLLWQISTKNMRAFGSEPKNRCRDRRIQLGSSLARLDPEPDWWLAQTWILTHSSRHAKLYCLWYRGRALHSGLMQHAITSNEPLGAKALSEVKVH
jgi:hypothetical protein